VVLGIVLLAGLAVRTAGLSREPMWLDEALTWEHSSGSVSDVLLASAKDVHPPGYYVGVNLWRSAFGDGPSALRSYSVLWSLVGLAAVVCLAARVSSRITVALVAGLLMAFNPLDVYYAQEARSYSQLAALGVVATTVLWSWLDAEDRGHTRGRAIHLIAYAVAAVAVVLTHYIGVFLLVAHAVWVALWAVVRRRGAIAGLYAASATFAMVLYLPWIVFHERVAIRYYREAHLGWIPTPSIKEAVSFIWLDVVRAASTAELARAVLPWAGIAVLVSGGAALILGLLGRRLQPAVIAVFVWMLLGPPILAVTVSHLWHAIYYRPRFAVIVVPYFAVLFGLGCGGLPKRAWGAGLAAAAISTMLVSTAVQYRSVTKRGLPEFASLYHDEGPPDLVAVFPRHLSSMASYYTGDSISYPSSASIRNLSRQPGARVWIVTEPGFQDAGPQRQRQRCEKMLRLGRVRTIGTADGLLVREVVIRDDGAARRPD
jgi:uncharacterized membrane protein